MWVTPKTDWGTNPKSPMAADFNRIEGNIAHVLSEIERKKGSLVTAINTKQPLVTLESSYADMANAIDFINQNPRVVSGTATFKFESGLTTHEQHGEMARSLSFEVSGLPFKPSKLFVRGKFGARIRDNTIDQHPYSIFNSLIYDYGIVNNVLANPKMTKVYFSDGGGMVYTYETGATVSVSITFKNDGFKVVITGTNPSPYYYLWMLSSNNTQYWFAQE